MSTRINSLPQQATGNCDPSAPQSCSASLEHILPRHSQGLLLTQQSLLLLEQHVLFMPKSVLLAVSTSSKRSAEWASWVHPRKSFVSLREALCNALKPSLIFNGASPPLKHRTCLAPALLSGNNRWRLQRLRGRICLMQPQTPALMGC